MFKIYFKLISIVILKPSLVRCIPASKDNIFNKLVRVLKQNVKLAIAKLEALLLAVNNLG